MLIKVHDLVILYNSMISSGVPMVSNEEINHALILRQKKLDNLKEHNARYLFCDRCDSYYKLKPNETLNDFDMCHCGGNLSEYEYSMANFIARNELLDGIVKMKMQVPSSGYSGASRAIATLGLGLVGFAATMGGKTSDWIVNVELKKSKILISGPIETSINISDIKNTVLQLFSQITINFVDGSSIVLKSEIYAEPLNDIINLRTYKEQNEIIPSADDMSFLDYIKKAKELLDMEAITQEEFDQIKNKYLDQLK